MATTNSIHQQNLTFRVKINGVTGGRMLTIKNGYQIEQGQWRNSCGSLIYSMGIDKENRRLVKVQNNSPEHSIKLQNLVTLRAVKWLDQGRHNNQNLR